MAGENEEYDLLEDVGEEVDYDDFTLEDEDLGDLPADTNDALLEEEGSAGGEPEPEAAPPAQEPAAKQSNDSYQPSSATPSASAEQEAPKQQQGSNKGQQQPQPKKTLPVQKASVKKAQAERPGPARGRGEKVRGRGPGRGRLGERLADRSGRGHENGREHFPTSRPPSRPHSRHGTPSLSGGMQMPGARLAGLPMPPAMVMHGQRQGPHGPMGGSQRMQGPPMQQEILRPPPPRAMHQGMERGQQPQLTPPQNQRPREPICWQQPFMEQQRGLQHPHMERQHQRQPEAHTGPPRQLDAHMERQHQRQMNSQMGSQRQIHVEHQHKPAAHMLPNSSPALPFPPGLGDLLKQRLDIVNAGAPAQNQPRLPMHGRQPSKEGLQMALGMDAVPQMRPGQRPAPRQPSTDLQARLNAPLGYTGARQLQNGQTGPAQGALLRPRESAEELRMKEERLEQERSAQRKKETEAKRKAEELKAKKAEMARLRIQLQQAENRNIKLAQEAAERERKRKESEEFEMMKQKVLQLERLVAENAAINPSVAQQASAALPAAKAAAAVAAAAVAPAPAPAPQTGQEAALQVDFEEELEAAPKSARLQPKQSRIAKALPRAAPAPEAERRPKPKVEALPDAMKQPERKERTAAAKPLSIQERLSVRCEPREDKREQHKPPFKAQETKAVTDLRDLLSRNKRSRDGEKEEGRIRPSVKSRITRD